MTEFGKDGWLGIGSGSGEEDFLQEKRDKVPGQAPIKTVMVYLVDKNNFQKVPIGIITERRKSERDDNNVIGMLRLARKEFAKTEEEAKRIVIGEYA